LVNLAGEVIGIIDNSYNNPDTKNLLSAIGITELKGMITKLSNDEDIPYLGIYTQDIPSQARIEMGLPQGAYIFDIDMDSPAMLNGMQKGDIIVQVGTHEIRSAADYMNALRDAVIDRNLKVVVQRASVDSYEQMTFTVQPVQRE
ncbi:MAG: PDZ domain-containing protein, partial [Lachnospiraceae bacterium]|nr:PDZ domain-containing protein [Lachnospiraceae bacterium]